MIDLLKNNKKNRKNQGQQPNNSSLQHDISIIREELSYVKAFSQDTHRQLSRLRYLITKLLNTDEEFANKLQKYLESDDMKDVMSVTDELLADASPKKSKKKK